MNTKITESNRGTKLKSDSNSLMNANLKPSKIVGVALHEIDTELGKGKIIDKLNPTNRTPPPYADISRTAALAKIEIAVMSAVAINKLGIAPGETDVADKILLDSFSAAYDYFDLQQAGNFSKLDIEIANSIERLNEPDFTKELTSLYREAKVAELEAEYKEFGDQVNLNSCL